MAESGGGNAGAKPGGYVSSNRRPTTRPGVPCLIPVHLDSGEETVDGVITRISEMAASISLERPFDAASRVLARFRRPGDREEIEIAGSIIGFSRAGGIWRGKPSVALRFDTDLRHASPATADPEPIAPPPRAEPPNTPVQLPPEPVEPEPVEPPESTEPEPDDLWSPDVSIGDEPSALSWPSNDETPPPPSDSQETPVESGKPIVEAIDPPERNGFDFFEGAYGEASYSGDGDDLDESTIDRLQHQLQRSERRILASLPVTFLVAGTEHHGLACNFSPGGLYLAAETFPKVGTVVHVVFPLKTPDGSSREVEFNGVVRWYRKDRPDLNLPDGYGVQIVSFEDPEDRLLYIAFSESIMAAATD